MADAYGMAVFCASNDSVIDHEALVEALNQYGGWTSDGSQWAIEEGADGKPFVYLDGDSWRVQYPSVEVTEATRVEVEDEHGNFVFVPMSEATDAEKELNDWHDECATLGSFSASLAKHINQGWFEIACSSNEKMRYVEFMRLRVHANGDVEKTHMYSSPFWGVKSYVETYDPDSGKTNYVGDKGEA